MFNEKLLRFFFEKLFFISKTDLLILRLIVIETNMMLNFFLPNLFQPVLFVEELIWISENF